jgi:hypothetical protein
MKMRMETYEMDNIGNKRIAIFGDPVTVMVSGRVHETPIQVLDRIEVSNINLNKRIDRLERDASSGKSLGDETGDQEAFTPTDERAEDAMVNRIIGLASSDPALKRKTLDKIEAESMSREEAQQDLLEDAMIDRILKRGGKK